MAAEWLQGFAAARLGRAIPFPGGIGERGIMMVEPLGKNTCEVAVIGAGPYGLAVAAHLNDAGVETRVFGEAMSFWRRHMPRGMKLRSPWRATHIADPRGALSLDAYDTAGTLRPGEPVPLDAFVAYGRWFQDRAVPGLDARKVASVEKTTGGFYLRLNDGEVIAARRVVVALGLANQEYRPLEFAGLPAALVSHTCEHDDLARFSGRRVAVVGRGQSACESAALLSEAGAEVELIARGDIKWLGADGDRPSAVKRLLRPVLTAPSAVGPFPLNWAVELPGMVHLFPHDLRRDFSARSLKAGAAGWLRPRFANVKINAGRTIVSARAAGKGVALTLDTGTVAFDHVLLATGYRIDIGKLGILSGDILARLDRLGGSPRLSAGFESSVAGLHFAGSSAVASFGPLMRFVAGAGFAGRAVRRAALRSRSVAQQTSARQARASGAARVDGMKRGFDATR